MQARLRPRLLGAVLVAVLVFAVLPSSWPANSRLLVAWDIGVVCYLALAWSMAVRSSTAKMQERAAQEDESAGVVLALTLAASVASLAAIAVQLTGIQEDQGALQAFRLAIAAVTILCSWFFVHTIYAIHYAHEYYGDGGERRGLAFPHEARPDYWDFLYFSFNLGAAAQTSDVVIVSRRMRRLALAHTILSFLFNTTILALAVNVGAGLL
ncbi:membrane protein [Microvirga sp. BSC39]|nr:membrane protein [Microvirga sp. BSC39]